MYKDNNIVFKNNNIKEIKDIMNVYLDFMQQNEYTLPFYIQPYYNFSYHNDKANKEFVTQIIRYITISLQNEYTASAVNPASLVDMMCTQDYLEVLDCIESIKYDKYVVNARKLLKKYLYGAGFELHYNIYDINSCNIFFEKDLQYSSLKNKRILLIPEGIKTLTPSKSIRESLKEFLVEQTCLNNCSNTKYGLFSITNNEISRRNKQKMRFYIQISDIPAFLLFFTLYDGRDLRCEFPNLKNTIKKRSYLNPSKEKLRYSEYTYKTVLSKMDELKINDRAFNIKTMWHCDKIFFSNKLNTLFKYYKKYTSSSFLDRIMRNYTFTYCETLHLKEVIIKLIFRDINFIVSGLQSECLDFMMLFDMIMHHKTIPMQKIYSNNCFDNLGKDILDAKLKTLGYLYSYPYIKYNVPMIINNQQSFTYKQENVFSLLKKIEESPKSESEKIKSLEHKICNFLEKDKFYNFYYRDTGEESFSKLFQDDRIKKYDFLDFDTILKAMGIYIVPSE